MHTKKLSFADFDCKLQKWIRFSSLDLFTIDFA